MDLKEKGKVDKPLRARKGESMMKQKNKLLILAVFSVLVIPLMFAGIASAKYMGDGAVPNGVNGEWNTPTDGICVVGLHADGTLDVADNVTSKRDCIYLTNGTMNGGTAFDLRTLATSTACATAGGAGNDGAGHQFATSICVDNTGKGISLKDLDRTYSMCVAKGGIWKQTSSTPPYPGAPGTYPTPGFTGACVAYNWLYRGQDASGTPLPFGAKGTDNNAGAGFCSAYMETGIAAASCPSTSTNSSTAFGYIVHGTKCDYAYGVWGTVDQNNSRGTWSSYKSVAGVTVAPGAVVNLNLLTTMGDCLAAGYSWTNWTPKSGVVTIPPGLTDGATFDFTRQAVDADEGCLHCHSKRDQANGPAERQKDSYLMTGHKNMLRKVTAGNNYAGPDADGAMQFYTAYAAGALDFTLATASVSGTPMPLLYLFGDWMAPAPSGLDVVVNRGGLAKYNGTSNYSCAACHSAGWYNPGPGTCSNATATSLGSLDQATCEAAGKVWTDPGICNLSSKKSQSACVAAAGGIWYPAVGVQAIGTPGYTAAQPTDSFPGIIFQGAGKWDLEGIQCGRCHNATDPPVTAAQIALSAFPSTHVTGGGMGALAAGVGRTNLCFGCHQSIPTINNGTGLDADLSNAAAPMPVKNNLTAPAYQPEFSGHVLGGSFMNSPHARYTGAITPNPLGKYDLVDATGNDNSNYVKYSSKFAGYSCWQTYNSSSPAKTWIDTDGSIKEITDQAKCESLYGTGAWRASTTGADNASTFVAGKQGTCSTCHDVHNSLFVAGEGEPLRKECTTCHTDTPAKFGLTAKRLEDMAHPMSTGTPAGLAGSNSTVACEICHMPKATSGGFPMHLWRIKADASYRTFPTAAQFGIGATATKKVANASAEIYTTAGGSTASYDNAVWVDVDYACGQCHGGGNSPTDNPYVGATPPGVNYYTKATLAAFAVNIHQDAAPNAAPLAAFGTRTISGLNVSFPDASTDDATLPLNAITVNWGDGSNTATGNAGSIFSHPYATAGVYTITLTVQDAGGLFDSTTTQVNVPDMHTISGTIFDTNGSTGLAGVTVYLKQNGSTKKYMTTVTGGAYSFTNVDRGSYQVQAYKYGVAFDGDSGTPGIRNVTLGSVDATQNFTRTAFTLTVDTTGLNGVTVYLKQGGATKQTGTTAGTGLLALTGVNPGVYQVYVYKTGVVFAGTPATVTVDASKTVTFTHTP